MKLRLRIIYAFFLSGILAISANSCFDGDEYDFEKISDKVDWTPNMIVPVGYGTYSLWYLIDQPVDSGEDTVIFKDDDDFLYIRYRENDIFSYNAGEVLEFPGQDPRSFELNIGNIPGVPYAFLPIDPVLYFSETLQFDVGDGSTEITLTELQLSSSINVELTNPINTEVDLTVSFPDISRPGIDSVYQTFTIAANDTETGSLDLSNSTISFNEPYSTDNEIDLNFKIEIKDNGGLISANGNLDVEVAVQTINFELALGNFGQQRIELGDGFIETDLDALDENFEDGFDFADPRINLYLTNSVGVPFAIDANMTSYNNGMEDESLDPHEALIPNHIPSTLQEVTDGVMDTLTYNTANSDISYLMQSLPFDSLQYSGYVLLNPGNTAYNNIISKNSGIEADVEIHIPFYFSTTALTFQDTIDIDVDDTDKIMNAALVIIAENGLPLDAQIDTIFFADAGYNKVDSLIDTKLIDAAGVFSSGTQEGEVDPASIEEATHEIELNQSQITSLEKTKYLLLCVSVKTTGTGTVPVKLKGDYEIKFTLALRAQANLNN